MIPHAAVQRFLEACAADQDVVAAFIGGSHAAGIADLFSDLDLYVITTDEGYGRFFDRRREFLRRLG
ncbi:MAG: nucleotidyltransferase domain-containing protein [Bacillati bacterium ANGP1]|uniref:Nucleotidyltransferase domain-containing protein n=1 Tax=Candidatus Segetimicrobium genomatis TaxID=2569760 RepID=A0A537J182_9BACT|nr:MAG: nucleotidyltransferase domain-containing protein [Terrabacteria group bacterium ANGP1]